MEGKRHFLLDVDDLLKVWGEACSVSFATFKDIWKERSFSFIHEGRPKDLDRKDFMQTLYAAGLEVIAAKDANSLAVRAGALFLLYLLFETQPGSHRQRIRIYMSPEDLSALRDLVCGASREHLTDVVAVANRMIQSGALLFGAIHSRLTPDVLRGPAATIQRYRDRLLPADLLEAHFERPLGELLPLSQMDHHAREYNEARKRMVAENRGPSVKTDDSPYVFLAEDLLRTSAALDRQVRTALAAANPDAPSRAKSARPRAGVRTELESIRTEPDRACADEHAAAGSAQRLGSNPANVGNSEPAVDGVDADVMGDVGECGRPVEITGRVNEVVPEVAPLPVQSMPSIPGLFGGPAQPMEMEPPGSPIEDAGDEIDEDELQQEMDAVDEEESLDPTAGEDWVLDPTLREHGRGEQLTHEVPETSLESNRQSDQFDGNPVNGQLDTDMHSLTLERGPLGGLPLAEENGTVNGVLDRRRDGRFVASEESGSSDSDDDMEIRRPLPRALSPLL